ncbi:RNA polymerase sigma factor [Anabaena sp. PCC 7938]|uniref:RNA polymerase, sigma-24 subunit, ECF subfamily n=1 Tax=Anabaena cylindrica (strain ATCC 27899 / PCC 7122) TaxID=272123 RepID=K9ZI40_ANACC|nr:MULTISPECIES: RNA polymerase sigma factor [Anabaena]AFZ58903.1 RNA polymerase, sigma-24 subunit, ECF subfamily [Anabaena cylindrica PCC 7122]MCM2408331.1 RNA polymerase sigma factor [Anabaena sp. CCAP 1446/1C]BAY04080.1 RNA polymerase, sigma-24 subunit, ECF subfamily protein [Anabaena cylindrica PCC 7122]
MSRNSHIQANPEQELLFCLSGLKIRNVLPKQSKLRDLSQNDCGDFWELWLSYQDYFYNLCLKWMGGNSHDAEDVLNQAMLKACNQWKKYANEIIYPKAWLTRIIYNFCMDVHRKGEREAIGVENIDDIKFADHPAFASRAELPESNILNLEMWTYLRYKIESLPDRLRHPFILHCCQEKSYQDIAKQLTLSEENVRKRIQQARNILKKQLEKYLTGEDNTCIDFLSPSLNKVTLIVENIQSNETLPYGMLLKRKAQCDAVIPYCKSSIRSKNQYEEINYKVTVICLEKLPYPWYSSPNSLGWR